MKKLEKLILFVLAFQLTFLAFNVIGCGGDDSCSGSECGDGGTDTALPQQDSGDGAEVTSPQKDSGPEAPVVNCNDYAQYGQGWSCYAPPSGAPFNCDFTMLVDSGNCLIVCAGHFSCVVPPELSTYQDFTCLTYDSQYQRTCTH